MASTSDDAPGPSSPEKKITRGGLLRFFAPYILVLVVAAVLFFYIPLAILTTIVCAILAYGITSFKRASRTFKVQAYIVLGSVCALAWLHHFFGLWIIGLIIMIALELLGCLLIYTAATDQKSRESTWTVIAFIAGVMVLPVCIYFHKWEWIVDLVAIVLLVHSLPFRKLYVALAVVPVGIVLQYLVGYVGVVTLASWAVSFQLATMTYAGKHFDKDDSDSVKLFLKSVLYSICAVLVLTPVALWFYGLSALFTLAGMLGYLAIWGLGGWP